MTKMQIYIRLNKTTMYICSAYLIIIEQSVTRLTADPGVANFGSQPGSSVCSEADCRYRVHKFLEIDHEIILRSFSSFR